MGHQYITAKITHAGYVNEPIALLSISHQFYSMFLEINTVWLNNIFKNVLNFDSLHKLCNWEKLYSLKKLNQLLKVLQHI